MSDNLSSNPASLPTSWMILGKLVDPAKHGGLGRGMETYRKETEVVKQ